MNETTVNKLETSGVEPKKHLVATPDRATEKFARESVVRGLGVVLNILGCTLLGLLCLAIAGESGGWRIAGFVLLGLGGLTFFASQDHKRIGVKMARDGLSVPRRETPEATLKTFLSCLYDYGPYKLWKRAYSCITDTAQSTQDLSMPRDNYLREKMIEPKITTVDELQAWWEQSAIALGYHFAPAPDRIHTIAQSDDLAVLAVPIKLTWRQDQEVKAAEIEWTIPLVKRGAYWFMTAGYFWPSSASVGSTGNALLPVGSFRYG